MASPQKKKPCPFEGCGKLNYSSTSYCAEHVLVVKKCVFDGCTKRIAYWNFYGFCPEHRWMASTSKRPAP